MTDGLLVSVVMPAYNAESYIGEAIESIISQEFQDFELIVVNDGSNDETLAILEHYQRREARLRIYNQSNQGPAAARNTGSRLAQGRYIAWADADDINLPNRLKCQVSLMEKKPAIGICGAWVETFGPLGGRIWKYPTDDATIRSRLIFESSIANPSAMMRRSLFEQDGLAYNNEYPPAEDYDLWVRASGKCRFANFPGVLVRYRLYPTSTSRRMNDAKLLYAGRVRLAQLESLDLHPEPAEFELHQRLATHDFTGDEEWVGRVDSWLRKLLAVNNQKKIYPLFAFSKVLGERWFQVCRKNMGRSLIRRRIFWRSPLGLPAILWFLEHSILHR